MLAISCFVLSLIVLLDVKCVHMSCIGVLLGLIDHIDIC